MPQDQLPALSDAPPIYGLRLTLIDNMATLHDSIDINVQTKALDGDWESLITVRLVERGRDFLASCCQDIVHAYHYETKKAIVAAAQQNQRLAGRHARSAYSL